MAKLKTMIKVDTYTLYARYFPAAISTIPLFVLWFFLARETEWKDLIDFLLSLKFIGTVSFSALFFYFYAQFIRITSKHFERKYFTAARGFPTTYLMLYSDVTFSSDYKDKFRERVKALYNLEPLDSTDEVALPLEARNRLNECFNHVRLKLGDGKLVLKHNIWYGFWRNLIGGSIFSCIFCFGNIVLGWLSFQNKILVIASAVLLVVYLIIFAFHRAILIQNGEAYARQLISEFMAVGKTRSK